MAGWPHMQEVGKLFQDFISCSWDIAPLMCPTTATLTRNRCWPNSFSDVCLHTRFLSPSSSSTPRAAFNFSPCRNNKPEEGKRSLGPFSRRGRKKPFVKWSKKWDERCGWQVLALHQPLKLHSSSSWGMFFVVFFHEWIENEGSNPRWEL